MRYLAGLLSLGVLSNLTAVAQMGAGMGGGGMGAGGMGMGPGGPAIPRVNSETLIMTRIDDWAPAAPARGENKVDVFMFPDGQDSSNWTEAFQQEAYHTTAGMESARQVYDLRSRGDQQNCPNYTSEVRDENPDNGYSSIVWRQSCEPAPGQMFASLHKVILGNDRMYILSKIWKEEPSGRIWRQWENTFEDIYVCDPTHGDTHPCRALR